ncbi:MAG: DUF3617 family protein [Nitrospiraceae bacterium]
MNNVQRMVSEMVVTLGIVMSVGVLSMVSPAQAESFNVKPGAWEITTTVVSSGSPIPPDVLAKLPPERRARVKEAMRARAGNPHSHVHRSCLTQADLDQNRIIKEEKDRADTKCTATVISKTSTKLVIEEACEGEDSMARRLSLEAKTPEQIVAAVDITHGPSGKGNMEMHGRWLGASCDGVKE